MAGRCEHCGEVSESLVSCEMCGARVCPQHKNAFGCAECKGRIEV